MDPLAVLQASAGNAAVTRLLARVQRTTDSGGLTVSPANDPLEQEADTVADQIMRMTKSPQGVHRTCMACAKDDEERVARMLVDEDLMARGDPDPSAGPAPADVASGIRARRGGGQPLLDASRTFFEPRLGYDLGGVRVHHDEGAASLASRVHAQAFTVGSDIFFNRGRYAPSEPSGQRLIAHELAHVVQQGGGSVPEGPQASGALRLQRMPLVTGCPLSRIPTVYGDIARAYKQLTFGAAKLTAYNATRGIAPAVVGTALKHHYGVTLPALAGLLALRATALVAVVQSSNVQHNCVDTPKWPCGSSTLGWSPWCLPGPVILCEPQFGASSAGERSNTLIHEWGHRFLCSLDIGYEHESDYPRNLIGLLNADNFANLIRDIN